MTWTCLLRNTVQTAIYQYKVQHACTTRSGAVRYSTIYNVRVVCKVPVDPTIMLGTKQYSIVSILITVNSTYSVQYKEGPN
jgi:hypothetical protein